MVGIRRLYGCLALLLVLSAARDAAAISPTKAAEAVAALVQVDSLLTVGEFDDALQR